MAINKRSKTQRLADMALIECWALQAKPVRRMAELLAKEGRPYTISFQQVHYDLKRLEQIWLESAKADIQVRKAKELAALDLQAAELWEAWQKSKLDAETKTVTKTEGGDGTPKTETRVATESRCGDPAYLRLLLENVDRRAKLLGLYASQRQEISGPDGSPTPMTQQGKVVVYLPDNGRGPEGPIIDAEAVQQIGEGGNGQPGGNGS